MWIRALLAFVLLTNIVSAGKFCLANLHKVTDKRFWLEAHLPTNAFGRSGLSPLQIDSIIGNSTVHAVVIGRIYSYLASTSFDPTADSSFANLQEKRVAYARDIFRQVDLSPWVVTEVRLSNGVHAFVGYSGHYMKVKPNGSLVKGNLNMSIHDITEDMLIDSRKDQEIFPLEEIK